MILLSMVLLLAGCHSASQDTAVDLGDSVAPLEQPDLTGIDLESAYSDALRLALGVTMSPAWQGHKDSLALRTTGCPDFFAGPPEADLDIADDAGGIGWSDHCETAGGLFFSGYAWWDGSVSASDEVDGAPGSTLSATRDLVADGVVGDDDGVIYEFNGEGQDALDTESTDDGYSHWVYSSLVNATLTGSDLFADAETPAGWRADLYLYATGGDASTFELDGNVYYFQTVLQDRFDSVASSLQWTKDDPTGCALEPKGYLSIRDSDAFWYDLVFSPTDSDTTTGDTAAGDLTTCDGCGTLYVRGVEQGTVCPDLSWLWDGAIVTPSVEDFILTLRDLEAP